MGLRHRKVHSGVGRQETRSVNSVEEGKSAPILPAAASGRKAGARRHAAPSPDRYGVHRTGTCSSPSLLLPSLFDLAHLTYPTKWRPHLHLHFRCHRKTPSELCIQSKARYDLNTQRKCKYEIRRPHEHPSRPSPTLVKQTIVHPSCSHLETNLPLACNKSFCFCFTWLPGCSRPSEPFPSKTCLPRPTFFARRPTTGLGVGYFWSDYPRYPRRATPSTVEPNLIVHPLTWVPTKTILRRARDMSSLLSV